MNEKIASFNKYDIYKIKNKKIDAYYLCVPSRDINNYRLFFGFADNNLSFLTKNSLVATIKDSSEKINFLNSDAIYILPERPIFELLHSCYGEKTEKYQELLNKYIQPIIENVYKMFVTINNGVKSFEQTITFIYRDNDERKFANWIASALGSRNIKIVSIYDINDKYYNEISSVNDEDDTTNIKVDTSNVTLNTDIRVIPQKKTRRKNMKVSSKGFSSFGFIIFSIIFTLLFIGYVLFR